MEAEPVARLPTLDGRSALQDALIFTQLNTL